ncbi:MAG: hypothetical protein LBV22_01715 [Mycoplasmataceae bacterium]|nr:hypothetical protein [Mycoplasmataceae bacterium]
MKKYKKISWKKVIIYVLLKGYNEPIKHILPTIKKNTIGQPVLSSGYISISHSTTYDAYAISKTLPVGIDIEPCNRTTKDNKIPNIKTWTIAEAVIKTLGSKSIKDVYKVQIDSKHTAMFHGQHYRFKTLKYKGHYITVSIVL